MTSPPLSPIKEGSKARAAKPRLASSSAYRPAALLLHGAKGAGHRHGRQRCRLPLWADTGRRPAQCRSGCEREPSPGRPCPAGGRSSRDTWNACSVCLLKCPCPVRRPGSVFRDVPGPSGRRASTPPPRTTPASRAFSKQAIQPCRPVTGPSDGAVLLPRRQAASR